MYIHHRDSEATYSKGRIESPKKDSHMAVLPLSPAVSPTETEMS